MWFSLVCFNVMASPFLTVPRFTNALNEFSRRNPLRQGAYFPQGRYKSGARSLPPGNMALKRTRPSTRLRRRPKRYRRRGIIRRRIPRAITSHSKVIRCLAVNYLDLTNGANGNISPCFAQINSVDDPFVANGTGQPLGYDQWKALYKKAKVLGCKLTLRAHNAGTVAVTVGCTPMPASQGITPLSDYEYYMEHPGTVSRLLSADVDHCELTNKVSVKRHMQVANLKDADELEINLVSETQPTNIAYWHIWAQSMNQSSTYSCEVVIKLEYIIMLYDPVVPARSIET